MELRVAVLGLELLCVTVGAAEPDEHEHLDDHTGQTTGFVQPPAVPSDLDMPARDLA